jgi:hypothetical protein
MSPSRPLDSPCSNFGQLIPRNQVDSHDSSTNMFSLQHVDSPSNLVQSQSRQLLQQWDLSSFQHSLGHYPPKGTSKLISLNSKISNWPYPSFNDPTCLPYLYQFTSNTIQLAPCSIFRSQKRPKPLDIISSPRLYASIMPNAPTLSRPDFFNKFLHTWAQNPNNPCLLDKPPPPFHLGSNTTQSNPPPDEPIINHSSNLKLNRKLLLHKFNYIHQLHESFVIERLYKCKVEPIENRAVLKTKFKVPKLIIS